MSIIIREDNGNAGYIQSGKGIPVHMSPMGTLFVDRASGILYINKDSLATWSFFYDSSMSLTGGTSGGTIGNYVPISGGTMTGPLYVPIISATTYQNLPLDVYVTGATYTNGTAVFTNNSGGTFSLSGINQTLNTALGFYLSSSASTVPTYYRMVTTPVLTSVQTISNSNVINNQLLATFASATGTTFTTIEGLAVLHIHAANTNSGKDTELYFSMYKRDSGGTESFISQSSLTDVVPTASGSVSTDAYLPNLTFNSNERLVIKVYANVFGVGTAPDITFYLGDSTFSRLEISTIPINLNSLVPYVGAINDLNMGSYGLIANIVSATTYQNLPLDVYSTGGTYSNGTIAITNNTGGTFNISGLYTGGTDVYVTGLTFNNNTLTISDNTGGTLSTNISIFTGLTATTISATTYQNLPLDVYVTGATYGSNLFTFRNNTGGTFTISTDFVNTGNTQTITGAKTFSANTTFGNSLIDVTNNRIGLNITPTSRVHIQTNSIGVTQNDANGLLLENTTSATLGNQQYSPPIVLVGKGWSTTNSTSLDTRIRIDCTPIQNTRTPFASFRVQRSYSGAAYTDLFSVYNPAASSDTVISLAGSNAFGIGGGVTQFYGSSSGFAFYNSAGSVQFAGLSAAGLFTFTPSSNAGTSGTVNSMSHTGTFAPTSGNATWTQLRLTPTINQTGGASGITRSIYINPTITAAADFRALDISNGSVAYTYVIKGSTYAITNNDNTIECSGGTFTTTLPTAVGCIGREYIIKNTGSGVITVATTSSQTIDGSTTYSLSAQYKYVVVRSNNSNWVIVANN